jgi:hypothetical protein
MRIRPPPPKPYSGLLRDFATLTQDGALTVAIPPAPMPPA